MRIKPRHLYVPALFNLMVTFGMVIILSIFPGLLSNVQIGMFEAGIIHATLAMVGLISVIAGLIATIWFSRRRNTNKAFVRASIWLMFSGIAPICLYGVGAMFELACYIGMMQGTTRNCI